MVANLSQRLRGLMDALINGLSFIGKPIGKIFGPTDHQYPATGVQPYEGDDPDRQME